MRGDEFLADIYKVKGSSKLFDGVAVHPYGASPKKIADSTELFTEVIKKAHDKKVGLWVTEIGAGSKKGGSSLNRGKKGQAKLLTGRVQVLHEGAQEVQRPGGRLVQLAGLDNQHLRVVPELRPDHDQRQGEAVAEGVREADARLDRQALST